jgi:hypothetical protein
MTGLLTQSLRLLSKHPFLHCVCLLRACPQAPPPEVERCAHRLAARRLRHQEVSKFTCPLPHGISERLDRILIGRLVHRSISVPIGSPVSISVSHSSQICPTPGICTSSDTEVSM